MEPEIIDYIKKTRSHGMSDLEIKQNLLNAGWDASTVEESFTHLKAQENQPLSNKDEDIRQQSHSAIRPTVQQNFENSNLQHSKPVLDVSENQLNNFSAKKPFYKKVWVYLVLVVVLVLGGGGLYWYQAFGFNSATKVWATFSKALSSKVYKQNFKFSYSDPGTLSNKTMGSFQLKDLSLSMEGSSYSDLTDIKNPQSKSDFKYTFGTGTTNLSTEFKVRLIDKILYLNVGENPFLNSSIQELAQGKKVDWIKIDLNALEEEANKQAESSDQDAKKIMDEMQAFSKEIGKIWDEGVFVKVDSTLGREKINNTYTFHFKNSLDKDAVKRAFNLTVDKTGEKIKNLSTNLQPKDLEEMDQALNIVKMSFEEVINKLEVKEFETWIGMKDFRLYKVKFVSNAPSVISLIETTLDNLDSLNQTRDSYRLAQVRQMASALELYYNDFSNYPQSKDGKPLNLTPTYIGVLPEAPTPADGTCTDYYNTYWYEPSSNGQDYKMYFCLGKTTGGYNPGIGVLTSSGIASNITCPTTPEQCAKQETSEPESTIEQKVKDVIQKIRFSAEIKVDNAYSDYNKTEKIEVPENAFDLMDVVKGKVQGMMIKNPKTK